MPIFDVNGLSGDLNRINGKEVSEALVRNILQGPEGYVGNIRQR